MNKIFKTITSCIAVLLLLVFSACLKQNLGDYKPDSVNNLNIDENLKDAYMVNVDDLLKLDANVNQSQGNGDLTFQWYYYSAISNATSERIVVSNKAQLELRITMATGEYFLVVESTDTKTGVKGYKKIALTVKRLTSEGWLLLTWKDNKTNLSIVTPANDVLKGFLKPSTEYPINAKPEKIVCINDWDASSQPITISTTLPNVYFLDYNTFEIQQDAHDAFKNPSNINVTNYATDIYNNIFYLWDSTGQLYQSPRPRSGPINFPVGFDLPFIGNYRVAKLILPVESGNPIASVFYDEQGKRFLYQKSGVNELLPFKASPVNAAFDMNHFPDEVKFGGLGAGDMSYVVGKSVTGGYNLYTMALEGALDGYPAVAVDPMGIQDNGAPTFFATSGKLPVIYYVANNNLYVYKVGEKRTTLLYSFPTDEKVSALSMLKGSPFFKTTPDTPVPEGHLGVAANKDGEGIFYTFDLTATGVLKGGKYNSRNDGFDPIVDITYKMMK
ncbi:PKD-like family lipoprotein [Pedobacter nyackensis]|uniref:PKD-like family lipoprotein n=1 Tax=Pedobacter nyackensis TaxID=475255 RepID=UPI00292CD9BB|nr:PKD-like family lipoprotein [Pedobacter nyackensis]